jgi:hypothetical protein
LSITTGAKIIVGLSRPKFLNDSALAGDGRGRDLLSTPARDDESETAEAISIIAQVEGSGTALAAVENEPPV